MTNHPAHTGFPAQDPAREATPPWKAFALHLRDERGDLIVTSPELPELRFSILRSSDLTQEWRTPLLAALKEQGHNVGRAFIVPDHATMHGSLPEGVSTSIVASVEMGA